MGPLARVATLFALFAVPAAAFAQSDLAKGFADPPARARPHTWWHWMNGNITREGITADLEAMKQIGLGGAQIFNVSESIPPGPILYNSPEWRALFTHAAREAERLGIELCMHNCAGWSSSGGPWITPELAMQKVVTSEIKVQGPTRVSEAVPQPAAVAGHYRDIAVFAFPTPANDATRIKDLAFKAGYESRYNQQPTPGSIPVESIIARNSIVDLTAALGKDGRLEWDVPAGSWTVLRIGHTPTGAMNAPSPDSGRGLECDKLSRAGLDAHWAGGLAPLMKDLGPLAGKVLNNCLIDSYEMGGQNWTPDFRAEFKRRRGYDPFLLLPVLTGRVVDSGEVSERFLWDFRRTIADLFADNYYSYFAELCHKQGLQASIEPYDGPFECLLSGRDADIPMGEFWVGGGESPSCKLAASVAHTYGRPIVGAESFTAEPNVGRWLNHPSALKSVGDLMYTVGINRYIIHRYAHQPWMNVVPGMTMGQWGTHFERTTTWWTQGSAWVRYLSRCQYLLQQGEFVADVCFFAGDAAPSDAAHRPELKAKGYDYDAINADVLSRRITVKDGRLALPSGLSYRVLVLPDTEFMTPQTLTRVAELVDQGATVIGPRPARSPSLSGQPESDARVAALAAKVWGDADGKAVRSHTYGKGKVIVGEKPEDVLGAAGVGPDCRFGSVSGKMTWIHRRAGETEIYFLSNQSQRSQDVECSFRVMGKTPELWRADTGEIAAAAVWSARDGRTTLPVRFDASGSVFVVFRNATAASDHLVSVVPPEAAAPARRPQIEIRAASYEAKDGSGGTDVTAKVAALVESGDTSIAATNGNFGDPAYNHVKRLRIEFTVDGKAMTAACDENRSVELVAAGGPDRPVAFTLAQSDAGPVLRAFHPGVFRFTTAQGKQRAVEVPAIPAAVEIGGAWSVRFPAGLGAPPSISLDRLASWTAHADAGVKYFSGTAVYDKEFDIAPELLGPGKLVTLDLGTVREIAEVTLNGKDLGIWWKPPFAADVSSIARPGKNTLSVRVTNLWVNRLIGDEQQPDDCEWNGKPIKKWPDWFVNHQPRPSRDRVAFTTWKHFTKDSIPEESGLLGPVSLRPGRSFPVLGVGSPG
ncbi:MAG: hypothetical protein JNM07_07250 [Phycisphaerae bacterium]|nr:hypothetical protein [Phycisphaerae bacterium]